MPAYRSIAEAIKQAWVLPAASGDRLPTERTLQAHFGVSRATISRALSALAAEGHIHVRRGSGAYVCPRRKTQSDVRFLGFIAPRDPGKGELQNPVLHRLYAGVERRATELGYQVLAASADYSIAHESELIEQFLRMGVQGIVLYPTYFPQPRQNPLKDPLAQRWRDIPIVLTDIGLDGWNRPMVLIDNFRLGHDLTWGLIERGRERVAFLHTSTAQPHTGIRERQRGWVAALQRAGRPLPESWLDWPKLPFEALSPAQADRVIDSLLDLSPRPDAVIAWDDPVAISLIEALQRRGVRVPEEILVAGFDNYEVGRYFQPSFPTTQPEFARMGELAIELVDELLREPTVRPRTLLLNASVHWRDSPLKGGVPTEL